jgi:PAS domain S-box-containing protein
MTATETEEAKLPPWVDALRSADGMFVTDAEQRIVAWSPSAAATLGHRAEDVIGRRCYEVIAGTDVQGHPVCRTNCTAAANAQRGRVTAAYDVVACSRDGQRLWLSNSILLARDGDERPLLLHVFRPKREAGADRLRAPLPAARRRGRPPVKRGELQPLSRRELETLRLLASGQTTAEIAEALTVSRFTARNHIGNAMRKLGARNRVEGLLLAAERHLI